MELLNHYKAAYEFHKSKAEFFKVMITEITENITEDLDKPKINYDFDLADEMKQILQKKKD